MTESLPCFRATSLDPSLAQVAGGATCLARNGRLIQECGRLFLEAVSVFLDDGVGKDFAGDALDLGAGCGRI